MPDGRLCGERFGECETPSLLTPRAEGLLTALRLSAFRLRFFPDRRDGSSLRLAGRGGTWGPLRIEPRLPERRVWPVSPLASAAAVWRVSTCI